MNLVPEWAPNVHPLLVHFPIALLFVAALFDGVALLARSRRAPRVAAVALYAIGAVAALAAYFTGRSAADGVLLPTDAIQTLTEHADWATRTVWFFGLYALARLGALSWNKQNRLAVHLPLALVGLAGLFLVYETGEHGSQMVYQHGVGVAAVPKADAAAHDHTTDHDEGDGNEPGEAAGIQPAEDGSWSWTPGADAAVVLRQDVRFLEGALANLDAAGGENGLTLTPTNGPLLFVAGPDLADLEARARLDVQDFAGRVQLVHHVQDAENYDFLEVGDGMIRQGRVTGGERRVFDEKPHETSGRLDLRAISSGTHFRGYASEEQLTHGHGDAPPAGAVGLRLDGTGPVRLERLSATVLDS